MKSGTRSIGIAPAALAALVFLSACGGSSTASETDRPAAASATSASATTGDPGAGQAGGDPSAFADCMKQNGVDVPDFRPNGAPPSDMPGPSGPGGNDPAFANAIEACKSLTPQGFGKRPSMDANAVKAFTTCMSDNGVIISDPADPFSGIDRNDSTTKSALETCRSLLPMGGGAGGRSNGSSASAPAQ